MCKPGAPLIAFSGTRTYHRTVVQIEDAGFEIRDQLAWMYGSGFPKSLDVSKAIDAAAGAEREVTPTLAMQPGSEVGNISKNRRCAVCLLPHASANPCKCPRDSGPATPLATTWSGYGTALKPAYEPAVLARKPLEGTVAANVAKWGVGALAIDASRIGDPDDVSGWSTTGSKASENIAMSGGNYAREAKPDAAGRWPANVILDEEAGAMLDAQSGDNVSRFFYCAKANRKERDLGCEALPPRSAGEATDREDGTDGLNSPRAGAGRTGGARNHHPTVKPIALMQYLARLIMPPNPGAILVPFSGSGSEMIGALKAGWPCVVGIERESEYVEIARARLKGAA